jgi:hypothetical protein
MYVDSIRAMGRECCQCYWYKSGDEYTVSQWSRGERFSRCRRCVDGYVCHVCSREFSRPGEMDLHILERHPARVRKQQHKFQKYISEIPRYLRKLPRL